MIGFVTLALVSSTLAAEYVTTFYTDDKCSTASTKAPATKVTVDVCVPAADATVMTATRVVCRTNVVDQKFTTRDCSGTAQETNGDLTNTCIAATTALDPDVKYKKIVCPACFALDDTAELEGGKVVKFSDLKVGDKVLAVDADGSLIYSPVFRFGYHTTTSMKQFLRFTLEGGAMLDITPGHHLFAKECCNLDSTVQSDTIAVGHQLFVRENGQLVPRKVTSIVTIEKQGAINPHTVHGTIIANGVAATHFTFETTWNTKSLAPLWYQIVHLSNSIYSLWQ